jgi:hypothetical protein
MQLLCLIAVRIACAALVERWAATDMEALEREYQP